MEFKTFWKRPASVSLVIEAKCLLVKVTEHMKRLNTDVSAFDSTLQQRPEILKAIRMDHSVNILLGVIDNYRSQCSSPCNVTVRHRSRLARRSRGSILAPNASNLRAKLS